MPGEVALFCIGCKDTHDLSLLEAERIVYALQAAEHDAAITATRLDPAGRYRSPREPDTFDCLQDTLRGSFDIELYAEHVEQQLLRCRDKAGPRVGDEDLCWHCGDLIRYVRTVEGSTALERWVHDDPPALYGCRRSEPDPERQP